MTSPQNTSARDAWLAPLLTDAGLVDAARLEPLQTGGSGRLWEAVTRANLASDADLVKLVAERFRLPSGAGAEPDRRAAAIVPEAVARKHHVIPIDLDEKSITIATADPRDLGAEQELEFVTSRKVNFVVASPSEIGERLDELYRPENRINRLLQGLSTASSVELDTAVEHQMDRDPAFDAPMAKLVDALISDSVRSGASDIHSEIEASEVIVRYRVDGILREVMRLPEAAGPSLVRRVKIVAGLDVTNSMTPQDGRSTARVDGAVVDLRVATAPVARRGEKMVIRILNKSNLKASIPDLALPPAEEALLMRMLGHREGMLLVTGPTGSGKTTTLYAVLNHLKTGKVNIVTVEDPVEYDVDGISQLQVNEAQGFTFATALRSVLRQDPDIVLVGEIRDLETATIAIQAGLTGHFVFSTLHTNDSASAVTRLRDMGVDSFKIGSVAKGILAQRLVRRLCERCAEPMPLDEMPEGSAPPAGAGVQATPRRAPGCKACGGSGFKGRIAVMELLPIESEVSRLIETGAPLAEVVRAARAAGMITLWESGLDRFWRGLTSWEEIRRVLGESQAGPGAGSPATAPPPAPVTAARPRGDGPVRILLADDDGAMRKLLRTVLEREGYDVTEALDGLETLDAIEAGRADLVILDHDMPNLTGLGVLEELRARVSTATIPVLMLTARTDDTELEALELGAQDFLTKPVQPRSLVARVRAVLKRAGVE